MTHIELHFSTTLPVIKLHEINFNFLVPWIVSIGKKCDSSQSPFINVCLYNNDHFQISFKISTTLMHTEIDAAWIIPLIGGVVHTLKKFKFFCAESWLLYYLSMGMNTWNSMHNTISVLLVTLRIIRSRNNTIPSMIYRLE